MIRFGNLPKIALLGSLFFANPASAQSSQSEKKISEISTIFQKALQEDDVEKIISISKFPIKSNEFGNIKNSDQFRKKYSSIFTPERKKGLIGQLPSKQLHGVYMLTSKDASDPICFLFKFFNGKYQFYCIDNVNE